MRWTLFGAQDGRAAKRTEKSCGSDAPTLVSSRRDGDVGPNGPDTPRRRWWQESPVTRETTKETVKTIRAGKAGLNGATCGD